MLLPIHIVAGGLAMILGAVALLARKGAIVHRKSGLLFVAAMVTMGFSGSALALQKSATDPNVTGGFLSAYFVLTALTTVRPASAWTRRVNGIALVAAVAVALVCFARGVEALGMPRGWLNGVPFFMFFFLGTVLTLAAVGDVRAMRSGGLRGGPRLARHLWRMCFALFIAAGSFFSIRARVATILPEPFTTPLMRALPIVLVFAAMFYWLWRVRGRRANLEPGSIVQRIDIKQQAV
jgi:uncharacterized membrane protein